MKMQIEPERKVKEKMFYHSATFEKLEEIIRYGFVARTGDDGIKLYSNSIDANLEIDGKPIVPLKLLYILNKTIIFDIITGNGNKTIYAILTPYF